MATTTQATQQDPCLGCGQVGSVGYKRCQISVQAGNPLLCSQVFQVDPVTGAKQAIKTGIANAQSTAQNAVTGAVNSAVQQAQVGFQNAVLGPLEASLPGILERIGLFLFSLVLIVSGFLLLKSGDQ
jgi:hypothetical protein